VQHSHELQVYGTQPLQNTSSAAFGKLSYLMLLVTCCLLCCFKLCLQGRQLSIRLLLLLLPLLLVLLLRLVQVLRQWTSICKLLLLLVLFQLPLQQCPLLPDLQQLCCQALHFLQGKAASSVSFRESQKSTTARQRQEQPAFRKVPRDADTADGSDCGGQRARTRHTTALRLQALALLMYAGELVYTPSPYLCS
jgi:hypothetical protein